MKRLRKEHLVACIKDEIKITQRNVRFFCITTFSTAHKVVRPARLERQATAPNIKIQKLSQYSMTLQSRDRFQTPLRNDTLIIAAVYCLLTACKDNPFNQFLCLYIVGQFLSYRLSGNSHTQQLQLNGSSHSLSPRPLSNVYHRVIEF